MDAQLVSDIFLWIIGTLSLVTFVGVVCAFWSLGRQAYRK